MYNHFAMNDSPLLSDDGLYVIVTHTNISLYSAQLQYIGYDVTYRDYGTPCEINVVYDHEEHQYEVWLWYHKTRNPHDARIIRAPIGVPAAQVIRIQNIRPPAKIPTPVVMHTSSYPCNTVFTIPRRLDHLFMWDNVNPFIRTVKQSSIVTLWALRRQRGLSIANDVVVTIVYTMIDWLYYQFQVNYKERCADVRLCSLL